MSNPDVEKQMTDLMTDTGRFELGDLIQGSDLGSVMEVRQPTPDGMGQILAWYEPADTYYLVFEADMRSAGCTQQK